MSNYGNNLVNMKQSKPFECILINLGIHVPNDEMINHIHIKVKGQDHDKSGYELGLHCMYFALPFFNTLWIAINTHVNISDI